MNLLKYIWLTFLQLARQVWLLPQSFANASKQRQHQLELNALEVERLDRIRNPAKYRGKDI